MIWIVTNIYGAVRIVGLTFCRSSSKFLRERNTVFLLLIFILEDVALGDLLFTLIIFAGIEVIGLTIFHYFYIIKFKSVFFLL